MKPRSSGNTMAAILNGAFVIILCILWFSNIILLDYDEMERVATKHNNHIPLTTTKQSSTSLRKKHNEDINNNVEPNNRSNRTVDFHIVFSTGCNAFQDWQSYVFFYQAWKSGQTGRVTRVASGCKDEQAAQDLRNTFQEQIVKPMSTRFQLHITPDYSKLIDGLEYKFFNKPLGLRHWLEEYLQFPTMLPSYENTIFVILDPDQYILRPFQEDYTGDETMKWHGNDLGNEFRIKKGKPFAQLYGFGSHFVAKVNENIDSVVKAATYTADRPSHLYHWTSNEVDQYYAAGPPYMAVASDMYDIVKTWAEIAKPVYELTTGHLSEMYAYSTAAAHLNLPHQLGDSFMISDPEMKRGEGWDMIDQAPPSQVCQFDASWTAKLPQVVHYCQRYFLGPYFFSKYKLPKQFLSCDQALIKDPIETEGTEIATRYETSVTPNGEMNLIKPHERKRHAFVLCQTITKVNAAVTFWKEQHCDVTTANFNKTYEFPFDHGKEHLKPSSY